MLSAAEIRIEIADYVSMVFGIAAWLKPKSKFMGFKIVGLMTHRPIQAINFVRREYYFADLYTDTNNTYDCLMNMPNHSPSLFSQIRI